MLNLAREITLFKKREIVELFRRSKFLTQNESFDLKRAPSNQEFGRILIIIPKKVGTSPLRNRLRRRVKAIFYQEQMFKSAYDWVIFFKPSAAKLNFQELKNSLTKGMES